MGSPFEKYAEGLRSADWGAAGQAYEASKGRATQNFASVGFGPTVTAKYQRRVQAARWSPPNVEKAVRNYTDKMSR